MDMEISFARLLPTFVLEPSNCAKVKIAGSKPKHADFCPRLVKTRKFAFFFRTFDAKSVETYCYLRTQNVTSKSAEVR